MQLRVLHRDREAGGERGQQRSFVLGQRFPSCREDGEQTDHVIVREQGHGHDRLDPSLGRRVGDGRQARVGRNIGNGEQPTRPVRAERELEQPLRQARMWPGKTDVGGGIQTAVLAEVDRQPVGVEQLGHPLDRRLERMGERELRNRLAHHGEQRACALELERDSARTGAGAERMRRAHAERRECRELWLCRLVPGCEEKLQRADGRLAQLQRC